MADQTAIAWADRTHNHWEGCQKVGPGCDHCYAEVRNARFGSGTAPNWGPGAPRRLTSQQNRNKPLRWQREAEADGSRPFVFCSSLADVFDNAVDVQWRRDLFDLIRETPHLTWLLLTKRPGMIVRLYGEAMLDPPDGGSGYPWPSNAAIGCTVVNQEEADRDVSKLLAAKSALNPAFAFLSMEPLLGPVDLTRLAFTSGTYNALIGTPRVDWVITGGETTQGDHRARPQHPGWFRSIRDQCARYGVPYHHKQNGEWAEYLGAVPEAGDVAFEDGFKMRRVGKDRAGRLLDGVTHDARPDVRP